MYVRTYTCIHGHMHDHQLFGNGKLQGTYGGYFIIMFGWPLLHQNTCRFSDKIAKLHRICFYFKNSE